MPTKLDDYIQRIKASKRQLMDAAKEILKDKGDWPDPQDVCDAQTAVEALFELSTACRAFTEGVCAAMEMQRGQPSARFMASEGGAPKPLTEARKQVIAKARKTKAGKKK